MTFMDLEDPRYAYMFGFLQADGHLASGVSQKGRLTAELNIRDIDILREFQRLTPYYSSISERTRKTNFSDSYTSATWTLCSHEARSRLAELGLPYGSKSKQIRPPRVPFSGADHLRGVVDADGSVGHTSQGFPFVGLTTASELLAEYVTFYVRHLTGAARHPRRNARDDLYNILYCKEEAIALAEHFYYPDCLALERKKRAAATLSDWVRPADMRKREPGRRWKAWEDQLLLNCGNPDTAAAELGRSRKSCNMRLWRFRSGRIPMTT
ncbi:LAGLIDADG family homing endonuclease [Streptomyces inhibens]|uniref:LAGLIDADG family homing endonuclease n=1 Tax=Streptomyces inhibens TaxID=2293571 RepID=UPI00402A7802